MLEPLLKKLGSRNATVREAAIRQASALPYEDLAQLVAVYRKRRRRDNVRSNLLCAFVWVTWIGLYPLILYVGSLLQTNLRLEQQIVQLWMLFATLPVLLGFAALLPDIKELLPYSARNSLFGILKDTQDPRNIGPLLTLPLPIGRSRVRAMRRIVDETLLRLLPQVSEEDAAAWTKEQRQALIHRLDPGVSAEAVNLLLDGLFPKLRDAPDHSAVQLAILRTMKQYGDQRELDLVKKLAAVDSFTPEEFKQVAQEILPYIERRIAEHRQTKTLLRPSDANLAVTSSTLLRPTSDNITTTPDQLLRSSAPLQSETEEATNTPKNQGKPFEYNIQPQIEQTLKLGQKE